MNIYSIRYNTTYGGGVGIVWEETKTVLVKAKSAEEAIDGLARGDSDFELISINFVEKVKTQKEEE